MATTTYTSPNGLIPSRDPQEAFTDAVRLPPGTYAQGTVLGEYTGRTGVSEVQTVTFTGTPTGGTYTLSFNGQITGPITYSTTNATHQANVQAALDALPNVGAGQTAAVVTSSGTVVTITFGGTQANMNMPPFALYTNSLTGGTNPTATVAETTPGRAAGVYYGAYNDAASDGTQTARCLLKYSTTVDELGNHQSVTTLGASACPTATAYFTGTFFTANTAGLALPGLDANGVADLGRMIVGTTGTLTTVGNELRLS